MCDVLSLPATPSFGNQESVASFFLFFPPLPPPSPALTPHIFWQGISAVIGVSDNKMHSYPGIRGKLRLSASFARCVRTWLFYFFLPQPEACDTPYFFPYLNTRRQITLIFIVLMCNMVRPKLLHATSENIELPTS